MKSQKRYNALLFGILCCALVVGFSDTAQAQTVSASSSTVTFSNIPGGAASSQQINLTTSVSTTAIINTSGAPTWLTVSPGGYQNILQGTPLVLTIGVNTAGLSQGPYSGSFTVSPDVNNPTVTTITVNLTVTGSSALTASPNSLTFTAIAGTLEQNIATQPATVTSSAGALNYNVSASTLNGVNWLVPFTTTGNTSSSNVITVGVNPASLSAGTYTGSILVQSTTTGDSVAIPVTLTLTTATSLTVTPSTLQPFLYQIGSTTPASQTLMISSTNSTSVPFTVSTNPQVSWLTYPLTGSTGTGGAAVGETFSVNPAGLAAGSYTTQITFTNQTTGIALSPITAQLVISSNPLLSVSNNSLAFTAQFGGGTTPSPQTVTVTTVGSGSAAVGFTYTSDSSWLSATATSSATPATLSISVNPSALSVGTYKGNIVVKPSNGDNYSLDIAVTLTVNNVAQLTAGPGALLFDYELNEGTPPAQVVEISATANQSISFTATSSATATTNCPSGWLVVNASASSTPTSLTVGVNPAGLTAGTCTGSVTVSYGSGASLSIPVTLNVSTTALLAVSMPLNFGVISASQGTGEVQKTINLTSTDPLTQVTFNVNSSSNGNGSGAWLYISSTGSETPQQVTILIEPGTLAPGTYTGTVSITAPAANLPSGTFTVPVTLTVTSNVTVTASGLGSNNTLSFSQPAGGAVPAAQTITLTGSTAGASFTTTIPSSSVCSWLTLSSQSGAISTTGTALSAGVQTPSTGALGVGTYPCQFTLNFLNAATSSLSVTATLTVGSAETYTVSPQSLSFTYQIGGSTPAAQQIMVTATPNAVNFTVGTTSSAGWLSTTAGTGTLATPQTLNVSINPANIPTASLVAGKSVTGTITISAPSISSTPTLVNVTVNVVAAAMPSPNTIFNSANNNGFGPIAPGELITIKGTNLGPSTPATFTVSNGTVSSTLSGVQVMFDATPGTPTYVSATQINVIVPWEVAGRAQTSITVTYNGATSAPFPYQVVSATPAFYTLNATGTGQAAVLNSDYSINGPSAGVVVGTTTIATKPATAGSAIAIYGTGAGVTNPGGTDGAVTPTTSLFPLAASNVTATIGGQPATVYFVGAAPGDVQGVFQINLQVPAGVTGNALPVTITVNGTTSYAGPTISVQ